MAETAIQKREIEISEGGLVKLDTYDSALRFAQSVIKSGLTPNSFKTPEAVLVAMQQGAELGLKPMQSLQHIAVINGRPSIYGKAATGIVMQSGLVEIFEEWFEGSGDNLTAFCKVKRKGLQSVKTAKFSIADAKKAGLAGKQIWREYTNDMLMYKARARAFSIFNDVLCGLPLAEDISEVPETRKNFTEPKAGNNGDPLLKELEIEDAEVEEVEPETEPPPPPPKTTTEGAQAGRTSTQSGNKSNGKVITDAQKKRMYAISNQSGVDKETAKAVLSVFGYESSNDVLMNDYDKIINVLQVPSITLAAELENQRKAKWAMVDAELGKSVDAWLAEEKKLQSPDELEKIEQIGRMLFAELEKLGSREKPE